MCARVCVCVCVRMCVCVHMCVCFFSITKKVVKFTGDLIPGSSDHTLLSSLSSNLFLSWKVQFLLLNYETPHHTHLQCAKISQKSQRRPAPIPAHS